MTQKRSNESKMIEFMYFNNMMKKTFLIFLFTVCFLFCACSEKDISNNSDIQSYYLVANGEDPFRNITITWDILNFSSPEDEESYEIIIKNEGNDFYFSWENLNWSFLRQDCIDSWVGEVHPYQVKMSVDYETEIVEYNWCGEKY